jgi:hypothetical protein
MPVWQLINAGVLQLCVDNQGKVHGKYSIEGNEWEMLETMNGEFNGFLGSGVNTSTLSQAETDQINIYISTLHQAISREVEIPTC